MSADEQMAAIGKFVTERAEARRQLALLKQELRDTGQALQKVSSILTRDYTQSLAAGSLIINDIVKRGGLERLQQAVSECQATSARIEELSKSLREAGAE